jgi:hypothetical protein
MCWENGMIGTTILTGFHRSRKQITIFVMAKELAARCFATKPKRITSSLFIYLFKSIYWTMSKRQSANGTQSPMRGTPPLQTVKIS